jgi:uncharacterized protein (TIGR02145 family)
MKKVKLALLSILVAYQFFGQTSIPQLVSFSAVVRDANNQPLVNTPISIRLTFKEGGQNGTSVYCALHQNTTNQNGFMSIQLNRNVLGTGCNGAPSTAFENIPWQNGSYWMEVEYQTIPGSPFISLGQLELASSFYAFAAGSAERVTNFDLTGASSGDVISYNSSNGKWEAVPASGIAGPQGPQGPQGLQGPSGNNGSNGTNGLDGKNTLIKTTTEAAGVNCATGGTKIEAGLDANNNGTLDAAEVNVALTKYVCNGTQGPVGNGYQNGTATNQINYWNGSAWVTLNPGFNGQSLTICNGALTWTTGGICPGTISALNCGSANIIGNLYQNTIASGVSASIPYTGGNGGPYAAQSINSTGVAGLTANLSAGYFANGSGSVSFNISGTPSVAGTATFAVNLGGQSCNLTLSVGAGQVFCAGVTMVVDVTNPTTGKTWMDRNLGASRAATSSTDSLAYGDLYQWGRGNDGHQCRNSTTTDILSITDQAGNANFILAPNTPYDWRSPQNTNLWQGVNGVNNPCPNGYRIPTDTELNNERLSWVQAPINSTNTSVGAFASPLKLPLAGYRGSSNGTLNNVGIYGNYWSRTISATLSRYLDFGSNYGYMINSNRADGLSVRCIKD